MRIMIIDDDTVINLVHETFFKKIHPQSTILKYVWAHDALEMLNTCPKAEYPDLIILDINMPHIDGWEFLDDLLISDYKIPVYVLTSSIDDNDRILVKKYPCVYGYFIKPIKPDDIRSILEITKQDL